MQPNRLMPWVMLVACLSMLGLVLTLLLKS